MIRGGAPRAPGAACRCTLICFAVTELSVIEALRTKICWVDKDTNAGQVPLRTCRREMDLRVILDKGAAGNTLAVLSRRICSKARVKTPSHACPDGACPADIKKHLTAACAYNIILTIYQKTVNGSSIANSGAESRRVVKGGRRYARISPGSRAGEEFATVGALYPREALFRQAAGGVNKSGTTTSKTFVSYGAEVFLYNKNRGGRL